MTRPSSTPSPRDDHARLLGPNREGEDVVSSNCNEVLLASEQQDFGLVSFAEAIERAKALAAKLNQTIYIRDPVSDRVFRRVRP
jgi:hypothetical protein